MIKYLFSKTLKSMEKRYEYDVSYLHYILTNDFKAFVKLAWLQMMSNHRKQVPLAPYFAAKLRATIWQDCGPCTQLVVNMALAAGLAPEMVKAIVQKTINQLPEPVARVVHFTDSVLAQQPQADELRQQIRADWGESGLLSLAFCISTAGVYSQLKYSLGYGQVCGRINIKQHSIIVQRPELQKEDHA